MKPSFRLVLATLISTNVLVPNAFGQVSRQDFKLQVSQKVQSPQENAKMVQAWKAGTGSSTQPTVSNGESSTNLKIENKTKLQLGGNGVSGGGQSVVFADGTVRFMDLLTPEERPTSASQVMSWEQVRKVFFVSKPYVKQLARKVPNFFDCAKQVFQAHASESKAYTRVIPELEKAQVLDTEFQIMDFADNSDLQEFLAKYPAPIFTFASPTLPLEYQQAVAAYAHNQIWMNARLRARMNSQDQCALAVHEGLRLANSLDYFKQLLTTSEIEILTRHLMGVENVDQRNEMQAVVEKSQQVKPTAEEISAHEQEVMQQAAALNLELEKNVGNEKAFVEIMERQSKLFMEYDNLRAAFFAAAFAPTIELEANFYNDTLVGPNIVSGLTEPLDGYAYWDVVNYKKVSLGQSYLGR